MNDYTKNISSSLFSPGDHGNDYSETINVQREQKGAQITRDRYKQKNRTVQTTKMNPKLDKKREILLKLKSKIEMSDYEQPTRADTKMSSVRKNSAINLKQGSI